MQNLWLSYKSINFPRNMHAAVANHRWIWIIGRGTEIVLLSMLCVGIETISV